MCPPQIKGGILGVFVFIFVFFYMRCFFLQNWTTVGTKRITGHEYQENWILTTQSYDVGWSKIPHQCFVLLLLCTILHVGQFFWKNIPKSLETMSMPGPLRIGS